MHRFISLISILAVLLVAGALRQPTASAQKKQSPASATTQQVLNDVRNTFGFVPEFISKVPETALPGFWQSMKGFQLNPNTALTAKEKELIGVAVASQIPCTYCTYFHTEAAKSAGATDQQIAEAVAMAGMTRQGSTLLNGLQIDESRFKTDFQRMLSNMQKKQQLGGKQAPTEAQSPEPGE